MTTVAAMLVLAGALLAFLGSLGLLRLKTFFERVHPPTMGTTLGTAFVLAGSMLYFAALERLVLHEILLGVFMTLSTPVTYLLLGRAALRREQESGGEESRRAPAGVARDDGVVAERDPVPGGARGKTP